MQIVRNNIALELRKQLAGIAAAFRRVTIKHWNQLCGVRFCSHALAATACKMLGQKIDNRVAELSHFFARKPDTEPIDGCGLFLLFQLRPDCVMR